MTEELSGQAVGPRPLRSPEWPATYPHKVERACGAAQEVGGKLAFALPEGVSHGDASIGNVFRDYRGDPILIDHGRFRNWLAHRIQSAPAKQQIVVGLGESHGLDEMPLREAAGRGAVIRHPGREKVASAAAE